MARLNSGNHFYDAELLRRIDARRYPTATVDLRECASSGPGSRYRLAGELTFHGVTRPAEGTVTVEAKSARRLVITGEQVFDIRDFAVPSPTVLMFHLSRRASAPPCRGPGWARKRSDERCVPMALMVGYVIGAKTGGKELEGLGRSVNALFGTDEFAEWSPRRITEWGAPYRELASMVDGEHAVERT